MVSSTSPLDPIDYSRPANNSDICPNSELRPQYCGLSCCRNSQIEPELLEANKP